MQRLDQCQAFDDRDGNTNNGLMVGKDFTVTDSISRKQIIVATLGLWSHQCSSHSWWQDLSKSTSNKLKLQMTQLCVTSLDEFLVWWWPNEHVGSLHAYWCPLCRSLR